MKCFLEAHWSLAAARWRSSQVTAGSRKLQDSLKARKRQKEGRDKNRKKNKVKEERDHRSFDPSEQEFGGAARPVQLPQNYKP